MADVTARLTSIWGNWTTASATAIGKAYNIEGAGSTGQLPHQLKGTPSGTYVGDGYYLVGDGGQASLLYGYPTGRPKQIPGPNGAIILLGNPFQPNFGVPT